MWVHPLGPFNWGENIPLTPFKGGEGAFKGGGAKWHILRVVGGTTSDWLPCR